MKPATKKKAVAKKGAAKKSSARKSAAKISFGAALSVEQLESLTSELQRLRDHPPLTRREGGTYEGDILGFVKGLRLSARVIYFLRECLSELDCEVSWGHVLNAEEQSCSPECDIIIHSRGHVREWNGGKHPVMHFKFIRAERVHAVVSCKSKLDSIDRGYPKKLKPYGIKKVFLFAECLRQDQLDALRAKAKVEGYGGLWCLYFTPQGVDGSIISHDQNMYVDFAKAIRKAVEK
jgi:hypothetical protein